MRVNQINLRHAKASSSGSKTNKVSQLPLCISCARTIGFSKTCGVGLIKETKIFLHEILETESLRPDVKLVRGNHVETIVSGTLLRVVRILSY